MEMVLRTSKDKAAFYKAPENKRIGPHKIHILASCLFSRPDCLFNAEHNSKHRCIGFYFKVPVGNLCSKVMWDVCTLVTYSDET